MPPSAAPLAVKLHRRIVRWAFERLYRELAWCYDAIAWAVSAGLWRRWGEAALPWLRGRVLELGFGPGHLQLRLPPGAVGVDASPQMVRIAASRLRAAGRSPRLARAMAQRLPWADGSFDTVVATFPSDYILQSETLAELRRVLAPGGQVVIVASAVLLRRDLYAWLVDLAYRLTLQAPGAGGRAAGPERLELPGLELEVRRVAAGPSEVLLLIGSR